MTCFTIQLPMPVSVNAAHTVGKGYLNPKTGKWCKQVIRSTEYTTWVQWASLEWRKQYPYGVPATLKGRIRIDYLFLFVHGARGTDTSDIDNRIKVLQDFFQQKFIDNDNQIDEIHALRRLVSSGENRVVAIITEIEDHRHQTADEIMAVFKRPYGHPPSTT